MRSKFAALMNPIKIPKQQQHEFNQKYLFSLIICWPFGCCSSLTALSNICGLCEISGWQSTETVIPFKIECGRASGQNNQTFMN